MLAIPSLVVASPLKNNVSQATKFLVKIKPSPSIHQSVFAHPTIYAVSGVSGQFLLLATHSGPWLCQRLANLWPKVYLSQRPLDLWPLTKGTPKNLSLYFDILFPALQNAQLGRLYVKWKKKILHTKNLRDCVEWIAPWNLSPYVDSMALSVARPPVTSGVRGSTRLWDCGLTQGESGPCEFPFPWHLAVVVESFISPRIWL